MATLKYTFDTFGEPEEIVKASLVPKPSPLPNEVLVRIKASSINPADTLFSKGIYGIRPQFPSSAIGFEGAGEVVEVGSDIKDLKVGQRVHFYSPTGGGWAEYITLQRYWLTALPDDFSFVVGSQLTINPLAVLVMLEELGVKKGDIMLQTAASSSFGRFMIQFAKLRGVKTINTVRREEQVEELKAIGADYVINTSTEDLVARVKEITNGQGVKFVADPVLGSSAEKLLAEAIAPGAVYIPFGVLSGGFQVLVDMSSIIFKTATIKGFWIPHLRKEYGDKYVPLYEELIKYFANNQVQASSKTFDGKTEFHQAINHSKQPGKYEKTVLLFN